ncbi:restriction endonuclease subunit S [Aggregatibacter sp. 2125159857]|uniref:restriction endonuclease subunit S n=1 Tax=Aggregatibacter sp. 2125159857 TaxID=2820817 RepID=UPI001AE0C233|nr:restriction endonuclease subunit S [Aggregatibacter sp. 2125159857]QTO00664.1 restriction endonuclease subunit S [Aggregatibacter sp. 2125159857]
MLFSEIILDNEKFRIDDEFFMKEYISAYRKIKSIPNIVLKDEISVLTDFHANGSYEAISEVFELLDEPNFAYMVRTTDLEINNFSDNVKYITKKAYNFLSKSQVFGGELLINKIGTPGKSYLMPYLNRPTSLGMNLFLIRTNENSCINEKFLYIYFNTNFGLKIINRKINGTVPLTIDKAAIRSLYVPKFESDFIYEISSLVDKVFDLELEAKSMYRQAELLLLDTLKLKDFNPPSQTINIKSFADSFGTSGRLDAEFYQEKYEKLIDKIKSYPKGYNTLDYFIKDFSTGFAYKSETYTETGIPLIRINNIGNGTLDISNAMLIPQGDISLSPKDVANENDILISMSGTIGNSCKVPKGVNAVVNQRIMRISPQNINVEVLPLIINSIIGKYQLERMGTGGVQTNISANDIKQIVIPNVEEKIQTQIADLIRQSNYLRIKSKGLLEKAKKAVELAIEKDQESALDFIKGKQTNDCNVH